MNTNKQAIDELTKVLDRLQFKRDRLREQLKDIESQYETISGALRVLGHTSMDVDLTGKTQLEALIAIAKSNKNELAVRAARRVMNRFGLFANAKNASSIIHTTITRSGKFERIKPGVYRLLEDREKPSGTLEEVPQLALTTPH